VQGRTAVGDSQREPAKHKQIRIFAPCFAGDSEWIRMIYFEAGLIGQLKCAYPYVKDMGNHVTY